MNEAAHPIRANPLFAVLADWRTSEWPRWLFVIKVLLAAFLALWIAFFLGFDSPRSAMLTVFIVALPSTGMALEKSAYRLIGTLVGSIAALTLIGLFGQHAPLLFLALATWAGLCTAGAAYMRNARSYGFVLSGYTACMIVLPSISHPLGVFDVTIARVTEISLGILCYALVNDVLFPNHQSDQLVFRVRGLYTAFATLCRDAMRHRITREELEQRHLQISADAAVLEAERLAALFEAGDIRLRSRKLHALHTATVATLTTFHTLHQLMERLRNRADSPIPALLQPLFQAFTDALMIGDEPARNAAEAEVTLGKLNLLLRGLPLICESLRAEHGAMLDTYRRLDLDTALELLQRFAAEYRALVAIYMALPNNRDRENEKDLPAPVYHSSTPRIIALAAGLRNAATLLILGFAWYALNWPSATGAVLLATIFCGLAASSPTPTRMIQAIMKGFLLGGPFAFICAFFILDRVEGFPMLIVGMAPFVAIGAYISTLPGRTGIGTGFNMMFAQMVAPENQMRFDIANFINDASAQIIGLLLASLMFALILPEHRVGSLRHTLAALWEEAERVCSAASVTLRHEFESRIHDLFHQLGLGGKPDATKRAIANQALTLLELGHAVISLRHELETQSFPVAVHDAIQRVVKRMSAFFHRPDETTRLATIAALDDALRACTEIPDAARLRTELHLLRVGLLDDPASLSKELPDAA
ncbi:MAG: FUSC family protein [Azonexus sp.]|jgi:uncharacterized membrane protein YccC|uniref:FUSC family protein n=1 Tax=Azonexus sp. TaxID=1872668 RepID=UPI00282DEF92|nr:FUSC family protein [Azonexus sp.]MDR0775035.1 FUSC family protein [Azonexus sp.]